MIFNFAPKEFNFFNLFEKQVKSAVEAARYFKELVSVGSINESSLSKMHQIEHEADEAAHSIIKQLNISFITPFDREDIFMLVKELDDITDMIYTIVSRLKVYKIEGVNKNLVEFASVIEQSVAGVSCAVKAMRNMKNTKIISDACVEVNRLENVGNTMRDNMLEELFENEENPIMVIKLKEIYQYAETVLDICEDVVHVVESILVKQA
jgi:hypothetical protein